MPELTGKLESLIATVAQPAQMEVIDVQALRENGKRVIQVFLDKDGGITLSDCERMSKDIGEAIDDAGIVPDDYVLEVSSPGLDRVLKKENDFVRFAGQRVRVTVAEPINGQRNFCGPILSCSAGMLEIDDVTGKTVVLPLVSIVKARLDPEL